MPEQPHPVEAKISHLVKQRVSLPTSPILEGIADTPEVQAERLWGLYNDWRRQEREFRVAAVGPFDRSRKKYTGPLGPQSDTLMATQKQYQLATANYQNDRSDGAKQAYTQAFAAHWQARQAFETALTSRMLQDPDVRELASEITLRWNQPETQARFSRGLRVVERERHSRLADMAGYRAKKRELSHRRAGLFGILAQKFHNGHLMPTLFDIKLMRAEAGVEQAENELETIRRPTGTALEMTRDKTDLAALAMYDDLGEYRRQLDSGFIWSESRLSILHRIMRNVSSGVWTMLKGEAGCGKTILARAAGRLLQGDRPLAEANGKEYSAARGLVGVQSVTAAGDYYTFGTLIYAFTGFRDSKEMSTHLANLAKGVAKRVRGVLAHIDEANLYPPGVLEGPLKSLSGRRAGEVFTSDELPGVRLRTADEGTGIMVSVNPAEARYDNRKQFPPSLERLFVPGRIDVDYPRVDIGAVVNGRQKNSAELFRWLVTALMTRDRRLLLPLSQIAPNYEEVTVDPAANLVTKVVKVDTKEQVAKHGPLFRFALMVTAANDSFSHKKVRLPGEASDLSASEELQFTVLDMGTVMGWAGELQGRSGVDMQRFLMEKLKHFIGGIDTSKSEDLKNFIKIAKAHGFDLDAQLPDPQPVALNTILTPKDIGYLIPDVPRPVIKRGEDIGPRYENIYFGDDPAKPPLEVNTGGAQVTVGGRAEVLAAGRQVRFSGRDLFVIGLNTANGNVVLSQRQDVLQGQLQIPVSQFEMLLGRGKIELRPGAPARRG